MLNSGATTVAHPYRSNLFPESENTRRFSVSSILQLEVKCKKRNANKTGDGSFFHLFIRISRSFVVLHELV